MMEQEYFLSGYCRQLDDSRMVSICVENENLTDCDCCYGSCIYEPSCTIAKQIEAHLRLDT